MKKLLTVVICLVVVFSFSETKAQISAGAGIVYGTNINSIGINANGKYEFNEKWSAAPAFTYFLKKKQCKLVGIGFRCELPTYRN